MASPASPFWDIQLYDLRMGGTPDSLERHKQPEAVGALNQGSERNFPLMLILGCRTDMFYGTPESLDATFQDGTVALSVNNNGSLVEADIHPLQHVVYAGAIPDLADDPVRLESLPTKGNMPEFPVLGKPSCLYLNIQES